jgi:hypothetical protein
MPEEQQSKPDITVLQVPVGGWNKRDNPEVMEDTQATVFNNVYSTYGHVQARKGFTSIFDTTWGNPINSLWTYDHNGTQYLMAATKDKEDNAGILVLGINGEFSPILPEDGYVVKSDYFDSIQFKGRIFLSSLYGEDNALTFDGQSLTRTNFYSSDPEIVSFNGYDIYNFCVYRQRLFFIQKGTSRVWFTKMAGSISGECDSFDVEMFTSRGGELVSLCEWSKAGADNTQSMLCCITSEGEVLLYEGDDPSGEGWKLTSRTQMPEPVGLRNTTSFKDDVAIVSKGGVFALSSIAGSTGADKSKALSDKIVGAFRTLGESFYLTNWQVIYSDDYHWIMVNIPQTDGSFIQFVLNLDNLTWSQFTGVPSCCYASFRYDMYFGGNNGKIYIFNKGGSDDGEPIRVYIQGAYLPLGTANKKKLKEVVLYLFSPYRREVFLTLFVDYKSQGVERLFLEGAYGNRKIAVWNKSKWNQDFWGAVGTLDTLQIQRQSLPANCEAGRRISIGIEFDVNDTAESDVSWVSTDVRYETSIF